VEEKGTGGGDAKSEVRPRDKKGSLRGGEWLCVREIRGEKNGQRRKKERERKERKRENEFDFDWSDFL
jgi:hypothetical protein